VTNVACFSSVLAGELRDNTMKQATTASFPGISISPSAILP